MKKSERKKIFINYLTEPNLHDIIILPEGA